MNIKRLFSRLTALLLALVMLMGIGVVAVASETTVTDLIEALDDPGADWDELMTNLPEELEDLVELIGDFLTGLDYDGVDILEDEILERLGQLENIYAVKLETDLQINMDEQEAEDIFDMPAISELAQVVGMAFNKAEISVDELILELEVTDKIDISGYDVVNAVWLDITFQVDGTAYTEELGFPITMTLPIPQNLIGKEFVVLHFSESYQGGYAEIEYRVVENKFTFVVTHFSTFAFAEALIKQAETKQSETSTVQDNYYHFPFMLVPVEEPTSPADTPSSWAKDAIDEARKLGLIPSELDGSWRRWLSRAEFCALAVRLYEYLDGKEITERGYFTDTTDINVLKLAGLGIVKGDGEGRFNPDGYFTREMALTLMYNLLARLGYALADAEPVFSDAGSISPWARRAVGAMQNAGILQGDGSRFSPAEEYTREMGVVTVMQILWWVKP